MLIVFLLLYAPPNKLSVQTESENVAWCDNLIWSFHAWYNLRLYGAVFWTNAWGTTLFIPLTSILMYVIAGDRKQETQAYLNFAVLQSSSLVNFYVKMCAQ